VLNVHFHIAYRPASRKFLEPLPERRADALPYTTLSKVAQAYDIHGLIQIIIVFARLFLFLAVDSLKFLFGALDAFSRRLLARHELDHDNKQFLVSLSVLERVSERVRSG
jgi:hypothetical protein